MVWAVIGFSLDFLFLLQPRYRRSVAGCDEGHEGPRLRPQSKQQSSRRPRVNWAPISTYQARGWETKRNAWCLAKVGCAVSHPAQGRQPNLSRADAVPVPSLSVAALFCIFPFWPMDSRLPSIATGQTQAGWRPCRRLRVRPWTGSVSQPLHHGSRVIFQSADGEPWCDELDQGGFHVCHHALQGLGMYSSPAPNPAYTVG
jgi:hypothetical protein